MPSNADSLPEIKILPENVANQIAAGEVVERPAAVVKELVENAIDAGATRVEIEFKHGGKSFIKVSDNGHGMTPTQALMSLEPHATSKIRTHEDLSRVASYGFRGEAVPSIASVSSFTLKTRAARAQSGYMVRLSGGKVVETRECGMAPGTEIIVENLFCTVPARRKFLRTDNVEAAHIVRFCRLYALALPGVSFTLIENSRTLFKSEKNPDVVGRVDKIFGREISSKIIALEKFSRSGFSVEGALLKPGEYCVGNRFVCVYINGRPVDLRAANSAIKEAYGASIPKGRYAAAFLFIEMDPSQVDVNVHPAKREVRVKNEFLLRDFLLSAITARLEGFCAAGASAPSPAASAPPPFCAEAPPSAPAPRYAPSAPAAPPQMESAADLNISAHAEVSASAELPEARQSSALEGWEFLAFYRGRHILFQTPKALVALSVSAALKRINYERIVANFEGRAAQTQALLLPISLHFDRAQGEFFSDVLDKFERAGFEIDAFGRNAFRVRAIPDWLEYSRAEEFLRGFVEEGFEHGAIPNPRKISAEAFARAAVKGAFGARIRETREDALSLAERLFSCSMPMLSPDGQPTCKELSL